MAISRNCQFEPDGETTGGPLREAVARLLRRGGAAATPGSRATTTKEPPMLTDSTQAETAPRRIDRNRYEKAIEASKRVRWDIDKDVLRGRQFDFSTSFLPDGLSR